MGVGIATFSYFIETSPNRIACEFSEGRAHRCLLVAQLDPASQVCGCLETASPLLARARVGLKPASPLRVRNGCFSCVFRLQRCHRFQRLLFMGEQW